MAAEVVEIIVILFGDSLCPQEGIPDPCVIVQVERLYVIIIIVVMNKSESFEALLHIITSQSVSNETERHHYFHFAEERNGEPLAHHSVKYIIALSVETGSPVSESRCSEGATKSTREDAPQLITNQVSANQTTKYNVWYYY